VTSHSSEPRPTPAPLYNTQYSISEEEFQALRQLIYRLVGIQFNDQKKMLVISRLSKRLRELRFQSFSEYLHHVHNSPEREQELVNLINQITTNKTDYFREKHHFEYLQSVYLPSFTQAAAKNIRIWSAGCSSGEEPYTIAMVVAERMHESSAFRQGLDIKILATDVDTNVLAKAQVGRYPAEALNPVPAGLRARYFQQTGFEYQAKPELQSLITFKRFNLMHEFPFHYGFNVIFCRNVLIYFSQEDRMQIIRKFSSCLRPDGLLILGHSESLLAENCGFRSLGNTIYQKH
jgi:chemotaxis protein methyltransferase CheR